MWQLVQTNGENAEFNCISPTARNKHAACISQDGYIYLFGGKSINVPLKDLWRFDAETNHWEEIKCLGDQPPSLQEHTMIAWNNKLYVFGGEVGYSSLDTPLWQLDLASCTWLKFNSVDSNSPGISSTQPTGRSGHSCVLYENAMYIYGGYQQLKGSLTELWMFDFFNEQWSLISGPCISNVQPAARHSHSAIVHQNQMYVYAGMSNLQAKSDFWKWNFANKTWTKIKTNKGPGELHGHSAIRAFNCMFVFGGERNGSLLQELWRFNLKTECWDKIHTEGMLPSPRSRHIAVSNPFYELNSWDSSSSASTIASSNNLNQFNTLLENQVNSNCDSMLQDERQCNKQDKNIKTKANNKENKCGCDQTNRPNEGTLRKFFRKKIRKNKLVRSISTNSYNISHTQNCNYHSSLHCETSGSNANQCKNDTFTHFNNHSKNKAAFKPCCTSCCNVNNHSSSCSKTVCSSIGQNTINENTTNKEDLPISHLKKNQLNIRKYDIGQLSCLNSSDELEDQSTDLFNKITQLQNELEKKIATNTISNQFAQDAIKKPRPKSELINELGNLEEDIIDGWDGIDWKRHSVHESMSYYSLCWPSPHYLPEKVSAKSVSLQNANNNTNLIYSNSLGLNQFNSNRYVNVRPRQHTSNYSANNMRKTRPKSYHTPVYYENEDVKEDTHEHLNNITENLDRYRDSVYLNSSINVSQNQSILSSSSRNNNDIVKCNQTNNQFDLSKTTKSSLTNENLNANINQINSTSNTVCSPVSINCTMDTSITQSLVSQSSGYQSLTEDNVFINANTNNSIEEQNNKSNIKTDKNSQDLSNLRLNSKRNNDSSKRFSHKLNNFDSSKTLELNNIKTKKKELNKDNFSSKTYQNNCQTIQVKAGFGAKKIPNSCSNVEICLVENENLNLNLNIDLDKVPKLPRVKSWDKRLMNIYSSSLFTGKDVLIQQDGLWNQDTTNVIKTCIMPTSISLEADRGSSFFEKLSSTEIGSLIKPKKKEKKKDKKNHKYQFCMFIFGGSEKPNVINGKQPISVWKFYI